MNPFIKVSLIFAAYILPVDWVITVVLVVGELGDVGLTEATDGVLVTLGVSPKEFDATIAPSPEALQPSKNRKNNDEFFLSNHTDKYFTEVGKIPLILVEGFYLLFMFHSTFIPRFMHLNARL